MAEWKPLKGKAYGHIAHLPGSRIGPGDHHCHPGQARICTEQKRDRHDRILISEKLDGSCVAVARIDGYIHPLTRAGYLATTSPWPMHHWFDTWAKANIERFLAVLGDGERLCGEWLAQAHGTRYALTHEPFVAFDLICGTTRMPYDEFQRTVTRGEFTIPRLLHDGDPFSIEAMLDILEPSGHGALDPVEGAVWRVERQGKVDFLAKYVRPDKEDGMYLNREGHPCADVWNWTPNDNL
jgi:hypothetical protein